MAVQTAVDDRGAHPVVSGRPGPSDGASVTTPQPSPEHAPDCRDTIVDGYGEVSPGSSPIRPPAPGPLRRS